MVNQHTIDRVTRVFDKYLDPNDCKNGGSTRNLLDSLRNGSVKLSDLFAVATAIDGIVPPGTGLGTSWQNPERLASLVGSLMNDTGLKEVRANLAEHVNALKRNCPGLVQKYEVQFS